MEVEEIRTQRERQVTRDYSQVIRYDFLVLWLEKGTLLFLTPVGLD